MSASTTDDELTAVVRAVFDQTVQPNLTATIDAAFDARLGKEPFPRWAVAELCRQLGLPPEAPPSAVVKEVTALVDRYRALGERMNAISGLAAGQRR